MAALPYTDGTDGNGISNVSQLFKYLVKHPLAFFDQPYMHSYSRLIAESGDAARARVLAIYDAAGHASAYHLFRTSRVLAAHVDKSDFVAMYRTTLVQILSRVPIYTAAADEVFCANCTDLGFPPSEFCTEPTIWGNTLVCCTTEQIRCLVGATRAEAVLNPDFRARIERFKAGQPYWHS